MQAIILAAGMGKRLKELTSNATKCMVKVNGVTLAQRTLSSLDRQGLSRIVVVIGYEGQKLKEYIETLQLNTPIVYVDNPVYYKTNNIYSLYLAKDYLMEEDTLLLESDIIFEDRVLERLIEDPYPSLALVAKYESWMDGTVVRLDDDDNILDFLGKKNFDFKDVDEYYKTVNIYKFSKAFSNSHYVPFLEAYCKALGNNEYYEQVLKVITFLDKPELKACRLDGERWYEIDDEQDLNIAESMFADKEEKLKKMQRRFGGYWRYPGLKDFCYLVNPFYPGQKLVDEMTANFKTLLCQYPSGMDINSLLAAKNFGLKKEQVCVGNGAAELIKALMEYLPGRVGVVFPTFEEYPNRKNKEDIVVYTPGGPDFAYTAEDLIGFYDQNPVEVLTLINPDNPSGNYIAREDVLLLAQWADKRGVRLIVDESFVDFAEIAGKEDAGWEEASLLHQEFLLKYPSMLVVKSISKSYGVPGLRLGIVASGDTQLIERLKKDVSIWNINSFAEFYMQICEKYKGTYSDALKKFKETRKAYVNELKQVKNLRVIPSQANYVMCEVTGGMTAKELAVELLDRYELLIKDLSSKHGVSGEYIRVAVKLPQENHMLAEALKELLGSLEDQNQPEVGQNVPGV